MIRLVNSTALGVIAFVWSLAMSRIWTKNDYVISKVKITLWRCSIVVSQWVFESGSMSSASCSCALTLPCFFFSCGVLVLLVSGTGVSLTNDEYVRCTETMRFIKRNKWVKNLAMTLVSLSTFDFLAFQLHLSVPFLSVLFRSSQYWRQDYHRLDCLESLDVVRL